MNFISLIKFIHLLIAVSLVSAIFFSLAIFRNTNKANEVEFLPTLKKYLIFAGLIATVTGIALVHPKHYTFHTQWIQVAIIGASIIVILIAFFFPTKKNVSTRKASILCFSVLLLLLVIIHDAVTKHTII